MSAKRTPTKAVNGSIIGQTCSQAQVLVFKDQCLTRRIKDGLIVRVANDLERERVGSVRERQRRRVLADVFRSVERGPDTEAPIDLMRFALCIADEDSQLISWKTRSSQLLCSWCFADSSILTSLIPNTQIKGLVVSSESLARFTDQL